MSQTNEVVEITIPVPWGHIAGITIGDDQDHPILCVHGLMDNLETFRNLIPLLPKNLYYVCIDCPGHGKSSHAKLGYLLDLNWFIMCLIRVIKHFKWSKLSYMGHSMGGHLGYVLAATYPDLVAKLILLDTIIYNQIPAKDVAKSLRDYYIEPTLKLEERIISNDVAPYSLRDALKTSIMKRLTKIDENQIECMVKRNLTMIGADQYRFSFDQRCKMLGPIPYTWEQLESISHEISCPVIVIIGKDSHHTKPHKTLHQTPLRKNTNVTIHTLDGDHDIHLVKPQLVASLISPFLTISPIPQGTMSRNSHCKL